MSRIEKAIEIAARQRNAACEEQGDVRAAALSPPDPMVEPPETAHPDAASLSPPLPAPARQNESRSPHDILPPITNPCLVMAGNELNSPAAEQYRKLKSVIAKMVNKGTCGKTLMVTSPVAGEGKSVTSLNLAISLAHEFDYTVLLVEADLRKPSLLQYLGLHAERGLSDCVIDGVDVGSVLVKTGIGGLSVLPAGRRVDNPVELFSSKRMHDLFSEIKSRYPNRFVIVDTTPLLPFAEPQYIANLVDGILLVVREHQTSLDKIKRAVEIVKIHNLIGVVNNGVSRVASLQGYHRYYGYHY